MMILTKPVLTVEPIEITFYKPAGLLVHIGARIDRMLGGTSKADEPVPIRTVNYAGRHRWDKGRMVIEEGDNIKLGVKIPEIVYENVTYRGVIPLCSFEDGTTEFCFDYAEINKSLPSIL